MLAWDQRLWIEVDSPSEWLRSVLREGAAIEELRKVARHLAVAASQLARDGGLPRQAVARFSAAEAYFRALAADPGVLRHGPVEPGPSVKLGDGSTVSIGELLAGLCRRERLRLENRSIDPDLVHAARELLTGLGWYLPGAPEGPPSNADGLVRIDGISYPK